MKNNRVLLTGALGFTGRYVEKSLLSAGFKVYGIGSQNSEKYDYSKVDLLDVNAIESAVESIDPAYVIHLAAIAYIDTTNINSFYEVNLIGTRNLLAALSKLPQPPKKVILASSANVYGNQISGIITEDSMPAPINDYAVSKYSMELMARLWADKFPITITRPFNYTGVGQSQNFVIPKIIRSFKERSPVLELGNIDVSRDFSDVRTVADIYVKLIKESSLDFKIVNICSGNTNSLRQVINLCSGFSNHQPDVVVNSKFVRHNEIKDLCGDTKKLFSLIPEIKSYSIEETLYWMMQDLRILNEK